MTTVLVSYHIASGFIDGLKVDKLIDIKQYKDLHVTFSITTVPTK